MVAANGEALQVAEDRGTFFVLAAVSFAIWHAQVSEKRVLEAEFGVLVQLSFNLHEGPRDIFYHFVLLLKVMVTDKTLCRTPQRLQSSCWVFRGMSMVVAYLLLPGVFFFLNLLKSQKLQEQRLPPFKPSFFLCQRKRVSPPTTVDNSPLTT